MNPMKIQIAGLAVLVPLATTLMAQVAAQGFEQALFSTLIRYCLSGRRRKEKVPL
jgi:hypothetical protein